jgi:uncharacterized membrane protein
MVMASVFSMALILSTLLCTLVAGFLLAFAIVTMPGIKNLNAREFVRAFQVIDGVIQGNQPIFMLIWVGSALTLLIAAATGFGRLAGYRLIIMIIATLVYLLGVQLPTITINVPLNNRLQMVDVDRVDVAKVESARQDFETRWNRWNAIRTLLAVLASALLIILVYML